MRTFIYCLPLLFAVACTNSPSDRTNSETNNYNPSNNPGKNGGRSPAEQLNNETNVDDDAVSFIRQAGSSNVFEIEMGKLAQQKAGSSRVKNFSAMIVKDHTKVREELKSLGANKNVLVNYALKPEQKQEMHEIQKLSGAAFDKRYMQLVTAGHEKDIENFKSGAHNRDRKVNHFADNALPVLKMHLDSAKAILSSLK